MRLELKGGAVAILDDDDPRPPEPYEWSQLSTGHVVGTTLDCAGNLVVLVLDRYIVKPPDGGWVVEHLNGNLLDNRRANLGQVRRVRARRPGPNPNNTSGFLGVIHTPGNSRKRPWKAQIYGGGRGYTLGYFDNPVDACTIRRAAELCLFGEIRETVA